MTTHAQQQHSRRPKEGEAPPPRPSDEELAEMGAVARRVVDQVNNIVVGAVTTEQLNSLKSDAGILGGMLPNPPIGVPGPGEPGAGEPPVVMSCTPEDGPDGTAITIEGAGFQTRGANSNVQIAYEAATINSWNDGAIVAAVVQGQNPLDTPCSVMLRCQDGQELQAGSFTFTAAARGQAGGGRRK